MIVRKSTLSILTGVFLFAMVFYMGCGDIDVAGKDSPVWLEVTSISYDDADVAEVDVCTLQEDEGVFWCTYLDEFVEVTFMVHTVDPDGVGGSSQWMDVHIKHYRVSFFRTDGGTNVPGTFDMYPDLYCPYETAVTHQLKLLHADQKLDPPLIWLNLLESFGYDQETGKPIIKGFAIFQVWGKDNSGKNVYQETQIPVQFADWGED